MSAQSRPNVVFIVGDNVGWGASAVTAAPIEQWDLIDQRLDCAWVFRPVAMKLGALSQSAAQYPHIKPGEEFAGYDRQPLASGDEFGV